MPMIPTAHAISDLLSKLGASQVVVGRRLDLWFVAFTLDGVRKTKWGTSLKDLLVRLERFAKRVSR